jgi:hypothetical protein
MASSLRVGSSLGSPAVPAFLAVRKRASMNYKYCIVGVEDVDRLQYSTAAALADHQELVVADLLGVWSPSVPHDFLSLLPIDTMFGNMVAIPGDPAKLHLFAPTRCLPTVTRHARCATDPAVRGCSWQHCLRSGRAAADCRIHIRESRAECWLAERLNDNATT